MKYCIPANVNNTTIYRKWGWDGLGAQIVVDEGGGGGCSAAIIDNLYLDIWWGTNKKKLKKVTEQKNTRPIFLSNMDQAERKISSRSDQEQAKNLEKSNIAIQKLITFIHSKQPFYALFISRQRLKAMVGRL